MKMVPKIRWNGDKIKINVAHATEESIFTLGTIAADTAKNIVRKKYGYLAASINVQSASRGTQLESPSRYARLREPYGYTVKGFTTLEKPRSDRTVVVGSNVSYALYIEFGTRGRPALPYLRPAMDFAKSTAKYVLIQKFKENGVI